MKKILFLSNHFITLYSFRKELISRLVNDGHEVYISIPADEQNRYFSDMGCQIIETPVSRRGMNPIDDLKLIGQYKRIMKDVRPDIIFSYTIKPNIYGCIASNSLHLRQVCNVTGTGATFLQESMLSKIARVLYRVSIKRAYKVFFQNTGDKDYFIAHKLVKDNWDMLPGSGVNLEEHALCALPDDTTVNFIFIGRIMGIKGIDQYLKCAKTIKQKYPNTCFYIAGFNEEEKYKILVEQYNNAGWVNYIGFQKKVDEWIRKCHCTILPSFGGEGVPNVLLESAAVGRNCIASNISGSREVVLDGVTGYLFETGNANNLIDKVERFLSLSYDEKKAMGRAGHERVAKLFSREIVIEKYKEEVARA